MFKKKKKPQNWWAKVHECDTMSKDSCLEQKEKCEFEGKKFKALSKAKTDASNTQDAINYWMQQSFQFFLDNDYRNARDAMEEVLANTPQTLDLIFYLQIKIEKFNRAAETDTFLNEWFREVALPIIKKEKKIVGFENSLEAATFEEPINEQVQGSSNKRKSQINRDAKKDNPRKGNKKNPSPSHNAVAFFNTTPDELKCYHAGSDPAIVPIIPNQVGRKKN